MFYHKDTLKIINKISFLGAGVIGKQVGYLPCSQPGIDPQDSIWSPEPSINNT